jgi:CDP-L-myo-inositol myo-inositolphosphotransferase
VSKQWDGIVSQHINRKISGPIARFLARNTKITPNHITAASFTVGGLSGFFFFLYQPIIGGVLAQLSSILDGVDGDLAVLTGKKSLFGGFLDSILDRYSDAIILLGISYAVLSFYGQTMQNLLIVMSALFGSILVSYSRARAESDLKIIFRKGFSGYAANRDIRLFIIMVGGILNQTLISLLVLAVLTNLVVAKRLYDAKRLVVR